VKSINHVASHVHRATSKKDISTLLLVLAEHRSDAVQLFHDRLQHAPLSVQPLAEISHENASDMRAFLRFVIADSSVSTLPNFIAMQSIKCSISPKDSEELESIVSQNLAIPPPSSSFPLFLFLEFAFSVPDTVQPHLFIRLGKGHDYALAAVLGTASGKHYANIEQASFIQDLPAAEPITSSFIGASLLFEAWLDEKALARALMSNQRQHHAVSPPEAILPLIAYGVLGKAFITHAFYVDVKRVSKGICFDDVEYVPFLTFMYLLFAFSSCQCPWSSSDSMPEDIKRSNTIGIMSGSPSHPPPPHPPISPPSPAPPLLPTAGSGVGTQLPPPTHPRSADLHTSVLTCLYTLSQLTACM
jgi:hypothetical protein